MEYLQFQILIKIILPGNFVIIIIINEKKKEYIRSQFCKTYLFPVYDTKYNLLS